MFIFVSLELPAIFIIIIIIDSIWMVCTEKSRRLDRLKYRDIRSWIITIGFLYWNHKADHGMNLVSNFSLCKRISDHRYWILLMNKLWQRMFVCIWCACKCLVTEILSFTWMENVVVLFFCNLEGMICTFSICECGNSTILEILHETNTHSSSSDCHVPYWVFGIFVMRSNSPDVRAFFVNNK